MERKILLSVMALSRSRIAEDAFVLVLEDERGQNQFSLLIGAAEARYIGVVLENLQTKRPLTHDLLLSGFRALGGSLDYVYLHTLEKDVYLASIHLRDSQQQPVLLDARASDAIAIALKEKVSIYTNEAVLLAAASQMEIYLTQSSKILYSDYTLAELQALLQKVLEKEDYESAARIRETIKKRQARDR